METQHANRSRVGAILLNPSREENGASRTHLVLEDVRIAKTWETLEIANLVKTPTRNSKELEQVATSFQLFLDARSRLETVLESSNTLVFAWGVAPLRGLAGKYVRNQVIWVISRALHHGHTHAWLMGGHPRHPSRWRQYVGPQRGLFDGATTVDRLLQGLEHCTVETAQPRGNETSETLGNLLGKIGKKSA